MILFLQLLDVDTNTLTDKERNQDSQNKVH